MFRKKDRALLELIESQTRSISAFVTALASDLADKDIIDGQTVNERVQQLMDELKVRK